METPHLDKEIEWLEWAKNGTNWNSDREKQLAEYKGIKQVLRIHDVVGRSELLITKEQDAFDKGYTKGWTAI